LLYMLRRATAIIDALPEEERQQVSAALQELGLLDAVPQARDYSVDRRGHIEVWARTSSTAS
ncbi:MAG: glutathione S-transferase, partial [Pseudomonas sp.]